MKTFIIPLFLGLCAFSIADPTNTSGNLNYGMQKDVYRLFRYVNQPAYYKDFVEIANSFKLEENFDLFNKPEYAKQLYKYFKKGILPRGEIFSVFNQKHLKQAIVLFRTLYHAKDYETFFKAAVWARQHINEGMFVYSVSVAIVHGRFTTGLTLPPIYEIFPNYFFNDEVIYEAQQYKQLYNPKEEIKHGNYKGYTIQANYSGHCCNVQPEESMSYFIEDVGLSAHYYYINIYLPYWLGTEELDVVGPLRSQYSFYLYKRLLTRYYLERLSNGFGKIPQFEYEYPIETGYYPSMSYTNGLKFPSRPNHANLYYHGKRSHSVAGNYSNSYTYVKDYERRIRDALDQGFVYTPKGKVVYLYTKDGFTTLSNLLDCNKDSINERYYGQLQIFARRLLGYSYYSLDEYKFAPSALEHYETSLRDPMFYQLYKRILSFVLLYQNNMGPYKRKQLLYKGVVVEDFEVDRLVTYFDYFYTDLSNAVYVNAEEFNEDSFQVRAHQYRLNNIPFNYKITVNSDKQSEAYLKVFIGPKCDESGRLLEIKENYLNFLEIDRFHYTLKSGKNVVERNSLDSHTYSIDRKSFQQLYKEAVGNYTNGDILKPTMPSEPYSIPQRLMLPKGKVGGQAYQIYVIIKEYYAPSEQSYETEHLVAKEYSIGYPFDRPIEFEEDFFVPNSLLKDVVIYHEKNSGEEDVSNKAL